MRRYAPGSGGDRGHAGPFPSYPHPDQPLSVPDPAQDRGTERTEPALCSSAD